MTRLNEWTEVEDVVSFTTTFNDFKDSEDKIRNWQKAYFDLLSWKNTWGKIIKLDIESNRENVYVYILVYKRDKVANSIQKLLESCGYGNIRRSEFKVRTLYPLQNDAFDIDEENEVYEYVIQ